MLFCLLEVQLKDIIPIRNAIGMIILEKYITLRLKTSEFQLNFRSKQMFLAWIEYKLLSVRGLAGSVRPKLPDQLLFPEGKYFP